MSILSPEVPMMSVFSVLVLSSTAFGVLTAMVAKKKGRNTILWFLVGFSFGLIGLLVAWKLSPVNTDPKAKSATIPIREVRSEAASPADQPYPSENVKRIPTSLSIQWYYINADLDTVGPLKVDELRKHLHDNKLDASTYIWCEEFVDWMQISEFQNSSTLLDSDLL